MFAVFRHHSTASLQRQAQKTMQQAGRRLVAVLLSPIANVRKRLGLTLGDWAVRKHVRK